MTACAHCGSEQPPGAKFCNSCGTSLSGACSACGAAIPPGSRFCNECGTAVGPDAMPREPITPVASRRITSVLFGDLVGFTSLSESRDQEDVRELLSRYFEECATIVARYGGTVEKFIGDAVMAVWGVPTTNEDDAERSVRAGLELVGAAAALGSEVGVPDLAMRVGIVTGEVAVTVGAQLQGMVAGDPVNTAARVQAAAAPGQVWVDETTRLLTSASVSYADVGSHQLKGKADPVPLWAARAVIATSGGAQRADGLEAPLVGLDRELRMVKEAYHRSEENGRPALLLVVGDAGTGKSRLGWEFSKYTDGLSTVCRWHAGKCVSYGEGVAYYALAEAVRSRLSAGAGHEDDEVETEVLIREGLAAYVEDEEERMWLAPRIGALLGTAGTASFQREDLFDAWTTFFDRVCNGTEPLVMLIDDAQYADEGLVRFIEHLLSAASFPCFVMLLARPELLDAHPDLATSRRSTLLHVDPLTDREMAELLDGLVEGLPVEVRDALVARAEGIPTYAVEMVRALIDRDLVVPRGGSYVLADSDGLDLDTIGAPASLQALISARLDRLSADERTVVDRASVAGQSAEPELLATLCGDVPDLQRVLDDLVRAQILTIERNRLSSEQGRYQFVQLAVRQVAYATLSRRERKRIHVQLLDLMSGASSPEPAPVAAQHAMAAIESSPDDDDVPGLRARAVDLLRQAADRAQGLGAPKEAAAHLRRALDLVGGAPERFAIQLAMARACIDVGRYDDAIALATEARAGFAGLGDFGQEATAAASLGLALIQGPADSEGAAALLEPYYHGLAGTSEHAQAYVAVLRAYMSALGRLGRMTDELGFEAVRAAERAEDRQAVARAVDNLAIQLIQTGNQLIGTMLLEQAVAFAREVHNLDIEGHALATLAATVFGEDLTRSLSSARAALEATLRSGAFDPTSLARVALAAAQWAHGDWEEISAPDLDDIHPDDETQATAFAALVLRARGESAVGMVASSVRREYGSYWGMLGDALAVPDAGAAESLLRKALDKVYDLSGFLDEFTSLYGAVLTVVPDGGGGLLDHLAQIVDGAAQRPMPGLRAHRDLVEALRTSPRAGDDAERHFRGAIAGYDSWGSPVYAARAHAAYGVWLEGRARLDEAESHLTRAREQYGLLGAVAWLEELQSARERVQV